MATTCSLDEILNAQHPLLARARRDAVHRPAPDQRAVDEADAARAARRDRAASPTTSCASAFKMLARVSRIMEQLVHAWDVLATMTPPEYSAMRPYLGQLQRLPELAVPLHRVRARQQERRDAQAARAPARPAGRGRGRAGARPRSTTRRCACWRAAACRAGRPPRARLDPALRSRATASSRPGWSSTATRRRTGTCTSSARS